MMTDKHKMVSGCGMYLLAIIIVYLATKKLDDFGIQMACIFIVGLSGPFLLLEYKLDERLYSLYPNCDKDYFFTVGYFTIITSIICSGFIFFNY